MSEPAEVRTIWEVTYVDETTGVPERSRVVRLLAASEQEARHAGIHYYRKRYERLVSAYDTGMPEGSS